MARKFLSVSAILRALLAMVQAYAEPYVGSEIDDSGWADPRMRRCNNANGCTEQDNGWAKDVKKTKKKKEKFCGIDFSKARGQSYVRFVLASSVGFPKTNSTPMVIDTQEVSLRERLLNVLRTKASVNT